MTLRERLIAASQRETGGQVASDRFDFQKNWALCQLLELHTAEGDYCIIFEHHEDVLVLNSANEPTKAQCIQVKTQNAAKWTLQMLLRKRSAAPGPRSILGKLYHNTIRLGGDLTLCLISNAPFDVELKQPAGSSALSRTKIFGTEIGNVDRAKIVVSLRAELSLSEDPTVDDTLVLQVCDLSLAGHTDHAKGKLLTFLENQFPNQTLPVGAIYRALFDEIRRKSSPSLQPRSFDELVKERGITRAAFEGMLNEANAGRDLRTALGAISGRMNAEAWPMARVLAILASWTRYEVERMDPSKVAVQDLRLVIREELRRTPLRSGDTLATYVDLVLTSVQQVRGSHVEIVGDDYVRAMILMEQAQ